MAEVEIDQIRGKIDFGIIAIRQDEHLAVLEHFPINDHAENKGGNRSYTINRLKLSDSDSYLVAVVRSLEPGEGWAQDVARDMIEDLDPKCLLLIGIAGGVPEWEFTLGDVVVATRVQDFSVTAAIENKLPEYAGGGGPMHKAITNILADLPARESQLKGWEDAIGMPRPPVNLTKPENFYGDEEWKNKVKDSLKKHFRSSPTRRAPKVTTEAIASSNILVKNTELIKEWQNNARHIKAVEMELAGVYIAARRMHREYPRLRFVVSAILLVLNATQIEQLCFKSAALFCACIPKNEAIRTA